MLASVLFCSILAILCGRRELRGEGEGKREQEVSFEGKD